jgi:hypothetical protein
MDDRRKEPTLLDAWGAIQRIEQAVFGDTHISHKGLVTDMETVKEFMLRWDKREYAWKLLFAAATSNVVLTVLSVVLTLWLGGGS